MDLTPLDNPIWNSLTTGHQSLAIVHGMARRYPVNISPMAAVQENSPAALADLRELVKPDERVGLFSVADFDVPAAWSMEHRGWIDQMVCVDPKPATRAPVDAPIVELTTADVPAMLALTAATKPGPFRPETIRMGRYFGVRAGTRDGEKLVAMAGQRLSLAAFVEISAVCTDPAHRGRGYAQSLVAFLSRLIRDDGRTPFLHMKTGNPAGKTYERCGFALCRQIQVTLITPA